MAWRLNFHLGVGRVFDPLLQRRVGSGRATLLKGGAEGGSETRPTRRQTRRGARCGFTLIELIFVMVLLITVASLVAPRMSSFFRGRVLTSEARRMLSLVNYAQSRAIAEGVPVLLWIDAANASYGIEVQGGHTGADDRAPVFFAEPTLRLEVPAATDLVESENGDETLGFDAALPAIRFNPDGFFDEVSVSKIVIRQGDDGALELVPTPNRLGYEILPERRAN